ncbi:MAG: transpeptidase family protein, partial [Planctomycetota bacterium]|nr:transpeptidase family protein [Planctomycetota bacterium]
LDSKTRALLERRLPDILEVSPQTLRRAFDSEQPFVWLKRRLSPSAAGAVRALATRDGATDAEKRRLRMDGSQALGFETEAQRAYPRGSLAFHVVGVTNIDQKGIAGLERVYEDVLHSEPAAYLSLMGGRENRAIHRLMRRAGDDASDLVLTLDSTLQHIAERALRRALRETGARAGSIVLMDPNSGDLLALANAPTGDLNSFGKTRDEQKRNRAVTDQFEPGSTFKLVTAAAAIETGSVTARDRFDCEDGTWKLADDVIRDHHPYDRLTFREIVEKSSNIGIAKAARRIDDDAFYRIVRGFGFGERSGIELPAEASGSLRAPAQWSGRSKETIAFGHEISVNAIQLISAFATVANGGVRLPPRIVAGTRDRQAGFRPAERPAPARVIRAETARIVTEMLEGVVTDGTGTAAAIDGYSVAGKTGTAQKFVDGRYSDDQYIASFAGFAPVRAPRVVALVVLDTPRGPRHQGGVVAAPVFRRLVERALDHLRIAPDVPLRIVSQSETRPVRLPSAKPTRPQRPETAPGVAPDVRGLSLRDALTTLARSGCRVETEGEGRVRSQRPAPRAALGDDPVCRLRLVAAEATP